MQLLQAAHYEQDSGDESLEEEELDQEQEEDAAPAPLPAEPLSKMPAPSSRW